MPLACSTPSRAALASRSLNLLGENSRGEEGEEGGMNELNSLLVVWCWLRFFCFVFFQEVLTAL